MFIPACSRMGLGFFIIKQDQRGCKVLTLFVIGSIYQYLIYLMYHYWTAFIKYHHLTSKNYFHLLSKKILSNLQKHSRRMPNNPGETYQCWTVTQVPSIVLNFSEKCYQATSTMPRFGVIFIQEDHICIQVSSR